MRILERMFCRAYQFVFKISLPFLPYRKPVLLKDNNEVAELLTNKNINKVLIVTDKTLRNLGITKDLEAILLTNNIKVFYYDETGQNPTTDNVKDAVKVYRENDCSAIIGFGGGSPIDCGKAVGACVVRPNKKVEDLKGLFKVMRRTPLYIAIPTTAGTGSETTLASVITDSKTKVKFPINDFFLIPDYALLDPVVTVKLPKPLTATTGIDALVHAVEAFIGKTTNKETRGYSKRAVKLIFENLREAYNTPENLDARKNMLEASYWAGNAFTRSYVGYVHALSHAVSGKYGTPHGLANSVFFMPVLERYGSKIYKKLKELALLIGVCDSSDSDEIGAKKFLDAVRDLEKELNLQDSLPEIVEADLPLLARTAEKEANPLYPVPVLMGAKELEDLYYLVMEKK